MSQSINMAGAAVAAVEACKITQKRSEFVNYLQWRCSLAFLPCSSRIASLGMYI
jgi:hypothetical protein